MRGGVVRPDGSVGARHVRPFPAERPGLGLVELDAAALGQAVLDVAEGCLAETGALEAVGITNQRGTTVVWDASTSAPVGPALSWQDLRTAGTCLELQAEGLRLAPSESATKLAWLLDTYDPRRERDLRFGTLDTWAVWVLSRGAAHVTDPSNAGISGMLPTEALLAGKAPLGWDPARLERFRVPEGAMPQIVPSSGEVTRASALKGSPPICAIVGDQQASLFGQGCLAPGTAKVTFGTGAFLDLNIGGTPPPFGAKSGPNGCLPVIAWQVGSSLTWGVEALMLSAGSAVSWLADLGIVPSPQESAQLAASCDDTGDVWFVPALLGLGTPKWDLGARTLFIGMTASTSRPQLVRAVLRGIAHRGADLLEAAEADAQMPVTRLSADGGMTANDVFVQELADACQRPVAISAELEATSLGAGLLAGLAAGTWSNEQEASSLARPRRVVEPTAPDRRSRWKEAVSRAERWVPELSELRF